MSHPHHFPSLIELEQTQSTNNYAMQLVRDGEAKEGLAVLAFHQTAGKGQRTKSWLTEEAKGLNLSILTSPEFLIPADGFQLLAATVVAVTDVLFSITGEDFKIKWPNDLYWKDKKAGGILIESVIQGSTWKWSVIGIGINVLQEQFTPDLPNPVSLKQLCGKHIDIKTLAENIREQVMDYVWRLKEEGFEKIYQLYLKKLYMIGETTKLIINNQVQSLFINGVTKEGLLETGREHCKCYAFGEVEWVY